MAIKDKEGNIVTLAQLKKQQKAPTKKQLEKSLVGRNVWWIDKASLSLYEGKVVRGDTESKTVSVEAINKRNWEPFKGELNKRILTFEY